MEDFNFNNKKQIMKIELTNDEAIVVFKDALCGCDFFTSHGLTFDYEQEDYKKAKEVWSEVNGNSGICQEDVWMEILCIGKPLRVVDENDEDSEYNVSITLNDVFERMKLVPPQTLLTAYNEEGDAETADIILQTVFFKEVVFS